MNTHCKIKKHQRGAVLIVSLLILLVLTLIGVSSLEGSAMEEKMASNSQTATRTFQKAESSIQEAVVEARKNPTGAVETAITGGAPATVDRSTADITSKSELVDPPGSTITPLYNSSSGIFVARRLEIVGTANVGNIRSRNIRGHRVFPLMKN